jgi:hypothetical protein
VIAINDEADVAWAIYLTTTEGVGPAAALGDKS